jgi:hypothetical protein
MLEIELWPKEIQGLKRSAAVLQETLGQVLTEPDVVLLGLALGLAGAAMFLGKTPTGGHPDAAVDSAARAGVKGNATGGP